MSAFSRPVSDLMSAPVRTVSVDDVLADAASLMRERDISCLGVTGRDGKLAGVLSQTDLLQLGQVTARVTKGMAAITLPARCVGDVMTQKVVSTAPSATVADAGRTMVERGIHRVFVVEDERAVGVFSARDAMLAVHHARVRSPISEHMSSPVITVDVGDPVSRATHKLYNERVGGVVVMEGEAPAGIFTPVEALEVRDLPPDTPVGEVVGYGVIALQHDTPLWRAAGFAVVTQVRRVLALDGRAIVGTLSTLDFARATTG